MLTDIELYRIIMNKIQKSLEEKINTDDITIYDDDRNFYVMINKRGFHHNEVIPVSTYPYYDFPTDEIISTILSNFKKHVMCYYFK